MVEKLRVTAHVCAEETFAGGGLQYGEPSLDAVSINDLLITAKVIQNPSGCYISIKDNVEVKLIQDPLPEICDLECSYLDGMPGNMIEVDWEKVNGYPFVNVYNPNHCHWWRSKLRAIAPPCGVDGCELLMITVDSPGEIPIPTNKQLVHSGGGVTNWQIVQNQIGPGMAFSLYGYFDNGIESISFEMDYRYYSTCCMTGGEITAVNGDVGDPSHTYTVNVMGFGRPAYPSDWVEWEVGDWVHLIPRPPLSSCQDPDRIFNNFLCAAEIVAPEYTIVPIKVGSFGD